MHAIVQETKERSGWPAQRTLAALGIPRGSYYRWLKEEAWAKEQEEIHPVQAFEALPEERAAVSGITGVARTTGAAVSPVFAGLLFASPALMNVPFFLAGGLKIVYDLLLFRAFRAVKPPEETA